jgi:hypothetical protein
MAPGQQTGVDGGSIEIAVSSDYQRAALSLTFGFYLASIQGCHQPLSIAENMFPAQHRHPFSVGISERIEGPSDDHD